MFKIKFSAAGLLVLLCWGLAFAAGDPQGFGGIKWGTDIKTLPAMQLMDSMEDIRFYQRPGDKLVFENIDLMAIGYGFMDDKYTAAILAFDLNQLPAVNKSLTALYGPTDVPQMEELYIKVFPTTHILVTPMGQLIFSEPDPAINELVEEAKRRR